MTDITCTFCNGEYTDTRPPVLVPSTDTVYGHQACINASTIGMRAVTVEEPTASRPGAMELNLMDAQTHLESLLTTITVDEVEHARHALAASTSVNLALAELRHSLSLVTHA